MSQPCRIAGCIVPIGDTEIMCRTHWFQVPKPLRDAIWHHYRRNKGGPSHLKAVREAIRVVESRKPAPHPGGFAHGSQTSA